MCGWGTLSLIAPTIALRSDSFEFWSNLVSSSPSQMASISLSACFWSMLLPMTRADTFSSSLLFQSIYSSMSGWSRSRVTIFAALLVVPPDFIAPAALSPIFRNESKPEELPPPERGSPAPLIFEKLEPVPEPYLKRSASRFHRPIMESLPPTRESPTDCMKQACGCGCSYAFDEYSSFPVRGSM